MSISDLENKNEIKVPCCKISMCPPKVTTDESIFDDAPLFCSTPLNITIELGSENAGFEIENGQLVNTGDVIGHIDDIPVKSIAKFTTTDVQKKYITGKYYVDENDMNIDVDALSNTTDENVDKISDILKENANVIAFIKDYILRFRFADLAIHTATKVDNDYKKSSYSITDIISAYEKNADIIINEYNDSVYKICDKDSVKARCEKDDLLGIKKDLDNEREKTFNKIFSQYNGIEKYGFSKGSVSDFMLYTQYMTYITNENFVYDENNPYIVELFYNINNFIGRRSKIELNATNISALITEFNTLCNSTIKKFWSNSKKDYYAGIKEIFKYDFYANNDSDLIEAKINDSKRVTLYEKVLKYLKTLVNFVPSQSAEQKYASLNVESIINSDGTLKTANENEKTTEEQNNAELEKKLKKIALTFTSLLQIERNSSSYDYFNEYISKEDLDNIFTLRNKLGDNYVNDYVEQENNPLTQANQTILKKYIGALKGITESESKILRVLSDKAIKWYKENSSKIDSGEIFDAIKEISWSSPSRIKIQNGEASDFYYLTNGPIDKGNDDGAAADDDKKYTEDSLETKYGVNSYEYWLKYMTMATLTHCMLPMYWPTGLLIAGAPMPLPVIYIPIYVLSGRVTTVFGLGMCGICPLPLILLVNMSDIPGLSITVLVNVIDYTKKSLMLLDSIGNITLSATIKSLITVSDENINKLKKQQRGLEKKIKELKEGVGIDRETLRNLIKRTGKNSTTRKKKKNGD